jgi:hypothetical protein
VLLTAPWCRRLIAGFSSRRSRFDPRPVRVRFVVCQVPLGQVLLRLRVPAPMLRTRLRLTRRTSGRILGNLEKNSSFSEIGNHWIENCNFHVVSVRTSSLTFPILRSAHTVCLCVLCGSENKQRLFPYTALTDWFL